MSWNRGTDNLDSHALPEYRERPIEVAIRRREDVGARAKTDDERTAAEIPTLTTTPETTNLLVRCTFASVADEQSLRLSLSRVDGTTPASRSLP